MKYVKKAYKNNKGSSMIMALAVMFILTAFAVVALTASLSNIGSSIRYVKWTKEYYTLDAALQARLKVIDNKVMNRAKVYTQNYIKKTLYTKETISEADITDETLGDTNYSPEISSGFQDFIKNYYNNYCTNDELKASFTNELFTIIYYYFTDYIFQDFYNNSGSDSEWYINVCAGYEHIVPASGDKPVDIPCTASEDISNYAYSNIVSTKDAKADKDLWDTLLNTISNKGYNINITALDTTNKKKVNSLIKVQKPEYNLISQHIFKPSYMGNPIWTNALTASDTITFGADGNTSIYGDVYAGDKTEVQKASPGSTASDDAVLGENGKGIMVKNSKVDIYGNVNSRGDIHVVETGGALNINKYSGTDNQYKNKIYNNKENVFFDKGISGLVSDLDYYIDKTPWNYAYVPFIYSDGNGGNAYCNNLAVEANGDNAEGNPNNSNENITVEGNVWTKDDIQLDAASSQINIKGSYIGLSSEGTVHDPDTSSSVINNCPSNSRINIGANIVVPGYSHIKFDGVEFPDDGTVSTDVMNNGRFYNKYESVSPGGDETFTFYLDDTFENPIRYYNTNSDGTTDDYYLKGTLSDDEVINFYEGNSVQPGIQSGINIFRKAYSSGKFSFSGYALGKVISTDSSSKTHVDTNQSNSTEVEFYKVKRSLNQIFNSRTMYLGIDKNKLGNSEEVSCSNIFSRLVNNVSGITGNLPSSNFVILNQDSNTYDIKQEANTYNVEDEDSVPGSGKIIYCTGDLIIKKGNSKGIFYGTIICDGNITVGPGVEIHYDEKTITDILFNNLYAREFFNGANGNENIDMGLPLIKYSENDEGAAGTGKRAIQSRYEILEWKEGAL